MSNPKVPKDAAAMLPFMYDSVAAALNRKLTGPETKELSAFAKDAYYNPKVKDLDARAKATSIARAFTRYIRDRQNKSSREEVDIRSMQITEIYDDIADQRLANAQTNSDTHSYTDTSATDTTTTQTTGTPQIKSIYVVIDSRFRIISGNAPPFQFYLNASQTSTQGGIQFVGEARDIVEMQINGEFTLPVNMNEDVGYERVTLFIEEMSSQAIPTNENTKFHFMFKTTYNNGRLRLVPMDPIYKFRTPITQIEQLTFTFRSPNQGITFDPDRDTATVSWTNPGRFTTSLAHGLASGDRVYFTDFASGSVIDPTINQAAGFVVTRVSSTIFSIPLDLTPYPVVATTCTVYYASKRVLIPMRFGSITP